MTKAPRGPHHEDKPDRTPFVFIHVGDLHVTQLGPAATPNWKSREKRLRQDLKDILADIDGIADKRDAFRFVYLPGDLAENGGREEYDVLAGMLGGHGDLTFRAIPGDHDRARGEDSLREYEAFLKKVPGHPGTRTDSFVDLPVTQCPPPPNPDSRPLPQFYYREDFDGVRCLFLDTVSAGVGQKGWGLDFRLGASQFEWLGEEVKAARDANARCAVFTHCYPSEMHEAEEAADVAGLIWDGPVALVEMGHTHYNEVAHDGRTMYAAARSVGQNEDGPVGYAVVALDGGVTSWRFKQLQLPWPFVLITSPADRRLATGALERDRDGRITVRALVLSDRHRDSHVVECRADDGVWAEMRPLPDSMYEAKLRWPDGSRTVMVRARDKLLNDKDHRDADMIEPAALAPDFKPRARPDKLGSPVHTIGAWPAKGLRGDPQGPNNGGHKW